MAESILRRLFSQQTREDHGLIAGYVEVNFGCGTCPNRRAVTVHGVGSVSLELHPQVPVEVIQSYKVKGSHTLLELEIPVGLNQEPCAEACPYAEAITAHASQFEADPSVLEMAVEPMKREF